MNNENNILQKLMPSKILGKGSEGIALQTHDSKYTVKIYKKQYLTALIFLKIVNYLQDHKHLPKTIYKSYLFTSAVNSFNRYISDNSLPNHFSYKDNNNLDNLSSKYKMDKKLFEIMKTYKITLKTFLEKLKNNNIFNKKNINNILNSLFQQGLLTVYCLYMEKGIIHTRFRNGLPLRKDGGIESNDGGYDSNNYSTDSFFIQKTNKSFIKIWNKKIKLYGYYLVLGDFGYAKSMELTEFKKYPEKIASIVRNELNPFTSINKYISLFMGIFQNFEIDQLEFNEILNIQIYNLYKELIKLYITSNENFIIKLAEFKIQFTNYVEKNYFETIF
jgi:hypothetical protein